MPSVWSSSSRRLMLNKRFSRMAIAGLCTIVFLILVFWSVIHGSYGVSEYYSFSTTSSFYPVSIDPVGKTTQDLCATFPKHMLQTIQPVLKMGHADTKDKLDAQFESVSACFEKDELLVYSDLDESVHGHQAIDVLADSPSVYYHDNPDFVNYLWQKEMRANGTLDVDKEATARIQGWRMDKFKFLPMIERAWKMKPNKDFYFFFETDTYVFWDNAFRFLQTFDPDAPLYMGSPSPGRHDVKQDIKTWFANGGPGFVLSRGAMKALLVRKTTPYGQYVEPPAAEKWLPMLRDDCCGDSVTGWALWNVSVPLRGYWPLFNPHPLHSIPFSDKYWCQPVMTLHKTRPEDMTSVWRWEFGQRQLGRPLLYSDVWKFHHPGDREVAENWDNGKWDFWVAPPEARIDSFEACGKYCKDSSDCLQYNWRGRDEQKCVLSRSFRVGDPRQAEKIVEPEIKDDKGNVIPPPTDRKDRWVDFKSGWLIDRIDQWRQNRNCTEVQWVGPSIKRIF
ncbi:unnamed protein product [Fusarium graminearum]|uniref:N-acetylgalactosaminide beta-1,3-galactosyltransferase n=1 Tax=Gibberella zeae TaxID=5518 RepID=A0A2H3HHH4_GIBZA|nr:hypothetical protein HG531_010882 [Fusarium graminearum]PCD36789.1 hypothetical protein FGRA07_07793 [Fusarium graminearum]CAF3483868.1 unnamed protein product [Fusarium graminearum]CAF3587485.1 unnamed protein product [Fusarium graminearum]CAF3631337.1 unnamed protein product [Fusarium graminearum]